MVMKDWVGELVVGTICAQSRLTKVSLVGKERKDDESCQLGIGMLKIS